MRMKFHKNMPRMSIDVNGDKDLIFVQQKWEYTFVQGAGVGPWTNQEKQAFHKNVDKVIWAKWSGKYIVSCTGKSEFAQACKDKEFKVNFDIKKVSSGGHWKVTVTKIPPGSFKVSKVDWNRQTIQLDSEDTTPVKKQGAPGNTKQVPAAHEFGHAIGNTKHGPAGHGDEYKNTSPWKNEKKSMMNVGNQLKKRHADHLILMLNKMIKDTTFKVKKMA